MAKIKFTFQKKSPLEKNLKEFKRKVNNQISAVMDYNAAYATGWLKQNAPWTDRTSAARTGLVALSNASGNSHEILMAYSVYYGIWLEVANSGKYAVITPGMRIIGKKVMDDMQSLLNSLGSRPR